MNILGIDFGTTKTLAARWDERTKTARTIRLGRGSDPIPTTLYCDEKGEFQFGEDADDMRALDAAGWKGRIKRDLGKGAAVVLQGRSFKVVNLVSRFLVYVRQRIEKEVFHGKIDHAIITVPALYGPAERNELMEAARKAGIKSVELVDEPVAAGRAFLHEKAGTDLGDHVLVFDWGGGTLDLALVDQRDGELQLNHDWIGGAKYLGGEDIDDAMIEEVDHRHAESHGRIDEQEDGQQIHIRRNLKEGKELLSRRPQHKFHLPYKRPQDFVWTRGEFEEFTAAITDKAIECLRKQLEKVRAQGIKPEYVLLVGGSSSMPVVKNRIEAELGLKALIWENSQTAVALGAATIWPAIKERQVSNEVECPHCDELVEVADDGEYECPHCGEDIVVGESDDEPFEVECPHCDELVEVTADGEYECPFCGENLIVGESDEEPFDVECPHCDELVEVPCDGEYGCPFCGENIIVGESDEEPFEVECPHCDELVEVPCDGEYGCPHCDEDFVAGDDNTEQPKKTKKRSSQRLRNQPKVPNKFKMEPDIRRTPQTQLIAVSSNKIPPKKHHFIDSFPKFPTMLTPLLFETAKKIFGF